MTEEIPAIPQGYNLVHDDALVVYGDRLDHEAERAALAIAALERIADEALPQTAAEWGLSAVEASQRIARAALMRLADLDERRKRPQHEKGRE